MVSLSVLAVFLVALFAIICLFVLLMPDRFMTPRRAITCPETCQPATIRIALGKRIRSLLAGKESLVAGNCSRWPEHQSCAQECLLQVDLHPPLLENALRAWCEDRSCALCGISLRAADWRQGRFAGLDSQGTFVSGAEMRLQQMPTALQSYRPVCWNCHCVQRELRASRVVHAGQEGARSVWAEE